MDNETVNRLTNFNEYPKYKAAWKVHFSEFNATERITFNFPLPNVRANLQLISGKRMEHQQTLFRTTNFALYSGKIYSNDKEGSFIFLRGKDGTQGGVFQFDGKMFEVVPLNKTSGLMREIDYTWFKGNKCGVDLSNEEYPEQNRRLAYINPCNSDPSTCRANWKILNAYPQQTINHILAAANNNWFVASYFVALPSATFKTALQNSGMNLAANKITFLDYNIGHFQFSYPVSLGTDIDRFRFFINTTNQSTIQNFDPDKSILMSPYPWGSTYGFASCIPYHTASGYNPNCANIAVADWNTTLGPIWTYAHELGHLFGARHDPLEGNDPNSCAHARIFDPTPMGDDRTLMSNFNSSNPNLGSILYFSEPGKYYNGHEIGVAGTRNNKVMVYNVFCNNANLSHNNDEQLFSSSSSSHSSLISYNNPVTDILNISASSNNIRSITIISSSSKLVRKMKIIEQENTISISVNDLKNGLYFLQIESEQSSQIDKFIKL